MRGLAQQKGDIQDFFDDKGLDSKGISRADLSSPEGQKMMQWLNREDVQKIHSTF